MAPFWVLFHWTGPNGDWLFHDDNDDNDDNNDSNDSKKKLKQRWPQQRHPLQMPLHFLWGFSYILGYWCYYPHTFKGWVVSRVQDFVICFPIPQKPLGYFIYAIKKEIQVPRQNIIILNWAISHISQVVQESRQLLLHFPRALVTLVTKTPFWIEDILMGDILSKFQLPSPNFLALTDSEGRLWLN